MSDTLEVLLKIHKSLKDISTQGNSKLRQPFDSVNTNVSALLAMQREAEKLSLIVKSVDDHAESFNESLKKAASNINKSNGRLERTFNAMGEAATLADKALGNIVSKTMDKLYKKTTRVRKEFENISNAFVGWRKEYKAAKKWYKKVFIGLDGIAAASGKVLSSLVEMLPLVGKVIGSVVALGGAILKSVVGVFGTALSAAGKFAKFLYTLPIGIANRASEMGGQLRQELVEVIGQAVENTKELFDLASNGGQAFKRLGSIAKGSLLTFQSVNSTMTKLFGYGAAGAAKMVADVTKNIGDMGLFADIFAESTTKSGKSIEFITRMTRGMAMGADDLNYVVREAMKNGEHYFETMTRMKLASDAASQEFGVNRKLLSKNFFQLRKDITQFGHLSDIELMRVAGRATQLGVEMKDLSGVFNKFGTFEDAANSAALLSQTFGMNIDALQLIRAEDPTEIVEMFRNSMLATGRSFDDLNRHEKSLMATHTGMSVEALKTTMNYRTLGKSYEEIKKIMNDQKPEERQIRAMKDMGSSMSEIQKIMDKKDFFTAFTDGLTKTILYNTKLGKSFIGINKQMERFYENGLTLTTGKNGKGGQKAMLEQALTPFAEIVDEIKKIFSIDSLNNAKKTILSNLGEFIKDITGKFDKGSSSKWSRKVESMFSLEYLTESDSFFANLARTSGKIIGYILRAFVALGPGLIKGIGNAFEDVLKFINNPSNTIFTSQRLSDFLGFENAYEFSNFTDSMTKSLKDMRSYIFGDKSGNKGIFSRIFDQIKALLGISKDSGILVTAGTAIGQGMIAALKAAGGFMSLLTGEDAGTGQVVKQDRDAGFMQQAAVATQNVANATASLGVTQGALQLTAETFNGTTEMLHAIPWDGDLIPLIVNGVKDIAYGGATLGADYNPINPGASTGFTEGLAGGGAAYFANRITPGGAGLNGAKAFARGSLLSVGLEAINYYNQNKKAGVMVNDKDRTKGLNLSEAEKQKMLDNASSSQLKQSATTVGGGLAGAAAGAALGSFVPVAGTAIGGIIGGIVGGMGVSSAANSFFGTESASESINRQIQERRQLQSVRSGNLKYGARELNLAELRNLDGDERLTRADIELLTSNNKEHTDKIIEALLKGGKRVIKLELNGQELAVAMETEIDRLRNDRSRDTGTPSTARLTPTAGTSGNSR